VPTKIGRIISHYEIVEKLGEGGMGVVYKAHDIKLKRMVALKFLPTNLTAENEARERFVNEAQFASALDHPNICTIYEIDETEDGQMFIAMAYYGGATLKNKIAVHSGAGMPIEQAIEIIEQIGRGLTKAHQHGVIHRDVKPANIIVTDEGLVKILDFGLAKLAGQARLTKTGATIGTVAYMSPEQVRGEEVDHRTDIWSLGVLLYELVTGKLPFASEYEQAMLYAIVHESPLPLSEHSSIVPENLQAIINKALEKDPEKRYQRIDDLLRDLTGKTTESAVAITSMGSRISARKTRPGVIFAGVLALAITVLLVFLISNQEHGPKVQTTHRQITFDGTASSPAISPDGQFAAYVSGNEGDQKVMLHDLAGGEPLEILSGLSFLTLKWMPEGSELITTGTLKDSISGTFFVPRLGGAYRQTFIGALFSPSSDGSRIAAISVYGKEILLFQMNTLNFDKTPIPVNGSYDWLTDVDWSPSGDWILILIVKAQGQWSIWTTHVDGSQQQQVVEDSVVLNSPRWSGSGEAIYYLRSLGPAFDLMKVPIMRATGEARQKPKIVQSGLQAGTVFTVSKNNQRLLYTRKLHYSNLWLVNLDDEGAAQPAETRQITSGTSWIDSPAISPDGKWLALIIGDRPHSNIFIMPIEGGEMRQLTFSDYFNASPAWSPDGKHIVYGSNETGTPRVHRIHVNSGESRIFENTNLSSDGLAVSWAPDGQILYHSPGNRNFRILDPVNSEERPLVANDSVGWMFHPCFSPDGKKVAVNWNRRESGKHRGPTTGRGVWLISLEDGSQTCLLKGKYYPLGWSLDGKTIYAWSPDRKPIEILTAPVDGSTPKTIAILPFDNVESLSISPDGKKVVCAVFQLQSDVWLMENFDDDLAN